MPEPANIVVAFVFARGGSKGLPGKNIRPLAGKPLIAHSIDVAHSCPSIQDVIVSTEDHEIAEVARRFGAETPFLRPHELATDEAPEWLAWQHAIRWYQSKRGRLDVFVSLPATSPFRSVQDVERCIKVLLENPDADIVVTGSEAARSPYFNMVKQERELVSLVMEDARFVRRQDLPRLFDLTTVAYVARPEFILSASRLFDGNVRLQLIPRERALDIDTELDFEIAESLSSRLINQSRT